ncbi:MAG: CRTAC1 family protein [Armatimonadota bacterium]
MRPSAPAAGLLLTVLAAGCAPRPTPRADRPIAGWFEDITSRTDVANHVFRIPGTRPLGLRQTIGNGAALADFDGDGNLDLMLVGDPVQCFRGDGKGGFTRPPGALPALTQPVQGCAVGDFDNDGYPDVYLSGYRSGALWRNDGGRFVDITPLSGIPAQPWGTAAAFADLDRDGVLDLVVANYVRYGKDQGIRELCDFQGVDGKTVYAACGPRSYTPLPAKAFRGNGDGRFVDITAASGFATSGRGLGIAIVDTEGDGKPRIAIANDEAPGDLLVASGGPRTRFQNIGPRSGTAYDADGKLHGGMGIDWGDVDNDGKFDLAVATFAGEPMSLYHGDGGDLYEDRATALRLATPTRPYVTFGMRFVDIDNDGLLDIATTNGHVMDNVRDVQANENYRQPSQLLRNVDGKTFEDATAQAGPMFTQPIVGRGLAAGDIDNDGRIDLVLVDSEGSAHILLNRHPKAGNWVGLVLRGNRSPRDGTGAVATVTVAGSKRVRHAHSDGSYLSASDPRVLIGLGDHSGPVDVEVRWPSGAVQRVRGVVPGRYTLVEEPGKRSAFGGRS